MAIYKTESNNTWYVMVRYQDWTGERKQKCKRGFATKREAAQWEQQFILQKKASMDMELESFCKLYEEDVRPRLKKSTWLTKENIIKSKILPYLGKRKVSEITAKDVLDWHNELRKLTSRKGKPLSPTYLKTIHGQLSTIFNHAIKFYDLSMNPARKAGTIGSEESKEMLFWTKAEYKQFSEEMMDKPLSYYAFQLLYWCGIRSGDDDDKIRLNQRKPSKYKGLRRFGPEKNLQRINKFMKERPIFYKNLIQMKENIRFYLRCFYCITKVMILQFNSENRTELARNG